MKRIPFLKTLLDGAEPGLTLKSLLNGRNDEVSTPRKIADRIRAYMGDDWTVKHSHVRDGGLMKATDVNEILKEAECRGDIKVTCYICGKESEAGKVLDYFMLPDPEGEYERPGKEERVTVLRVCHPCKAHGLDTIRAIHRVKSKVLNEHS
jgi:hypothetical protein